MTIITELLISECQGQRTISINDVIYNSFKGARVDIQGYNLDYDLQNKDVRKFIKSKLIKDICLFKRDINIQKPILFINKQSLMLTKEEFLLVEEIINALELFLSEKSKGFYRKLLKYLDRNGLIFLKDEFFKQVPNKLALFK